MCVCVCVCVCVSPNCVLVVGLFAAALQVHQASNEAGSPAIGHMTPPTPGCHGGSLTTPSTDAGVDDVTLRDGEELPLPPTSELALFLVFQYLSTLELLVVGGVCWRWRQVSRHSSLWKQVEIKDIMLPAQVRTATPSPSPVVVTLPSPPLHAGGGGNGRVVYSD